MNGKAYLTTHRIVYIDSERPQTNSVALELKLIKGREHFTGFLKSSPKILLRFTENTWGGGDRSHSPAASPSSSTTSLVAPSSTWICPICSFVNSSSTQNSKCQLCGVKRAEGSAQQTTLSVPAPLTHEVSQQHTETPHSQTGTPPEGIEIACPVCTFLNHPSMVRCEVCDSELGTFSVDGLILGVDGTTVTTAASQVDYVKFAFRGGGSSVFYDKLKAAMEGREWEKVIESPQSKPPDFDPVRGGLSGIMRNVDESTNEQKETLNQAFKDLDTLMENAEKVVKLAEVIKLRRGKESSDSEASTEEASFGSTLLALGIPNPVTKKDAGSIYHQELARQLAEFLEKFLEKENGMMALTDIYCIFNRARGVALISPEDLYKACSLFEDLNLPMRLRKFESGLNVVQLATHSDEQTAQRLLDYIRKNGPKTAIDLAEREKSSIFLITEQLLMAEAKGLLCRDETVEGIRFYENIINDYEWKYED